MPIQLLLAFFAAGIYTVSSLFFKQAYLRGASSESALHWSNFIGALFFAPMLFMGDVVPLQELWRPALISFCIFLGSWSTFAAIRRGDVSLVTPLLGTKVVFVAIAVVLLAGKPLSWTIWLAALLTAVGIFCIGRKEFKLGAGGGIAILLTMSSCVFFALTDVLIQLWAENFGKKAFLAWNAVMLGGYSLLALAHQRRWPNIPAGTRGLIVVGSLTLALQGMMMAFALGFFNDAARVNVVYGSRGLWSLALVWFLGHWFQNEERQTSRHAMLWRTLGTLLVIAALILAILEKPS